MKTHFQRLLICAWVALALPLALRAQTEPSAPASSASSTTEVSATTSSSTTTTAPAAPTAEKPAAVAAPTSSAADTPPVATPAPTAPAAKPAPAAPAEDSTTATSSEASTGTASMRTLASSDDSSPPVDAPEKSRGRHHRGGDNARVTIAGNSHLNKGESAEAVVAVAGNAESEGEVAQSVVAVAGNARATGPVGDTVVAVAGNVYVDSRVGHVVAIFGNVELGPNAEVMRDVVCVGGEIHRDPQAIIHGNIPNVGLPFSHLGVHVEWLQSYLHNCVLKGRPLAIAPHLAWAWYIALGCLFFYILVSLVLGRTVENNCRTLEQFPGASLLAAILTLLLSPIVIILLCVTVVGIAVLPFLAIGLLVATIFGRVVILAWIGRRVSSLFHMTLPPAATVLIGGIVMLALYLIPFIGFVVYKASGVLGLGVVVYTLILSNKREKAARLAAAAAAAAPASGDATAAAATGVAYPVEGMPAMAGVAAGAGVAAAPAAAVPPPVAMTALPRAGFWVRLAALLIDIVLVGAAVGILQSHLPWFMRPDGPGVFLVVIAVYGAILWKLKGTTIGGIVCGLRVVRVDGRPIDWATAFVRAAACFVSLVVACLGFIWVAFDDEKQSWHDKIAGTTVVHHRGNISLV